MAKSLILITQTADKDAEQQELSLILVGMKKSYSHSAKEFVGFSKKLNILFA